MGAHLLELILKELLLIKRRIRRDNGRVGRTCWSSSSKNFSTTREGELSSPPEMPYVKPPPAITFDTRMSSNK